MKDAADLQLLVEAMRKIGYDDVALARALNRVLDPVGSVGGDDGGYGRSELEAAGLVDGEMVSLNGLGRLLTGALGQLHQRVAALERRGAGR